MLENCIEVTPKRGDLPIEWFDESPAWGIPDKAFYKVYNDGSHYVATPKFKATFEDKHMYDEYGQRHYDADMCNNAKIYREKKRKTDVDRYFDYTCEQAIKDGLKGKLLRNHLYASIADNYDVDNLDEYVEKGISRRWHNLYARKKRFKRKADLNRWNYFVTFTYDDAKHDEEQFRRKLRKCLSNLSSRRDWRYMGVWERGEEDDRLHFHALMYVPSGEMLERVYERRDYSTRKHEMVTTYPNTFFENQFGRNDFKEIDEMELKKGNTIDYILKYIGKSNERIVYSRGIKDCVYIELKDTDIACEMQNYVMKYVLFDNVIDWERDVMRFKYEQQDFLHRLNA